MCVKLSKQNQITVYMLAWRIVVSPQVLSQLSGPCVGATCRGHVSGPCVGAMCQTLAVLEASIQSNHHRLNPSKIKFMFTGHRSNLCLLDTRQQLTKLTLQRISNHTCFLHQGSGPRYSVGPGADLLATALFSLSLSHWKRF